MKLAADRLLGIVLIGLAAFVAVQAMQLEVPFSYDPVGPRAFPLGLAILLAVLASVLIVKPGTNEAWPGRQLGVKLLLVLATLLVYALLFTKLGFIITSLLAVTSLARMFGAPWGKALLTGGLMAVVSYYLFAHALGISLPSGYWIEPLL